MVSSENKGMPLLTPNLDEFGYFASSTLNIDKLIKFSKKKLFKVEINNVHHLHCIY